MLVNFFFSEWRSINGFFSPFYDVKKSFVLTSLADRIKNRKNLRYLFIKIIKSSNYIFYGFQVVLETIVLRGHRSRVYWTENEWGFFDHLKWSHVRLLRSRQNFRKFIIIRFKTESLADLFCCLNNGHIWELNNRNK